MTARRRRGAALLAGGLLALIFTMISAVQLAGWTVGAREHTTRQVIAGPVDKLRVDAGEGDVVIVPSLDGRLHVDATARGSLHSPKLEVTRAGADVTLQGNCPVITFGPCRSEVQLQVPADATVEIESRSGDITAERLSAHVRLKTGSGDVSARGLSGGGELRTQSGDVSVQDARGNLVLDSASGDVFGGDLSAGRVRAETSSGDVDLLFREAPDAVDASTSSGDVHIRVPEGEDYHVLPDVGSGDTELAVSTDPRSERVIRARTSSGDVTVGHAG